MADAIIWADKLPDIIKKWILIVPMIFAIGGSSTGLYQYFDKQAVVEEKNKDIRDVTVAFQSQIPDPPKEVKKVIVRSNCGSCSILLKSHIKELH